MNDDELFRRIQLMLVYALVMAVLLVIFSCAPTQPTGGGITPWGAVDYCERYPESVWCRER